MKKILVLFNGLRFRYELVNRSIELAVENGSSLHAIFLKSEDEVKEGYIFPSDLDEAQNLNTTQDSEDASISVIISQMKVMADMARTKNIDYEEELLTDPPIEEILNRAKEASIVLIDGEDEEIGLMSVNSFTYKELRKKLSIPVEFVS